MTETDESYIHFSLTGLGSYCAAGNALFQLCHAHQPPVIHLLCQDTPHLYHHHGSDPPDAHELLFPVVALGVLSILMTFTSCLTGV